MAGVEQESNENRALLLEALAVVYAAVGGAEPALPCMPFLSWLLSSGGGPSSASAGHTAAARASLVRATLNGTHLKIALVT